MTSIAVVGADGALIRSVASDDAEEIRAIYVPYVERTAISFEISAPTVEEMAARIAQTTATYPWLVYSRDDQIIGYAYASQHRAREAYRWSVDVAVYVREGHGRQGIGQQLYAVLLRQLADLGYANAFAGIALPNASSVGLHEKMGFTPLGIYRKVGYKLGAWHDVGWWQLAMHHPQPPAEPRRPASLSSEGGGRET